MKLLPDATIIIVTDSDYSSFAFSPLFALNVGVKCLSKITF